MTAFVQPSAEASYQQDLLPIYLGNTRQRFKNEVNRLTSGAMAELLAPVDEVTESQLEDLSFLMSYLYIYHWLRHHVPEDYRAAVLESFRGPKFGFLMDLLLQETAEQFIGGYIQHWQASSSGPVQGEQLLRLLSTHGNDPQQLKDYLLSLWKGLGLFQESYLIQFKQVGREERDRYAQMLGEEDKARLALVDALPDSLSSNIKPRFSKLGMIPAMGCPQTCRHCMFTWRPPKPKNEDPELIYEVVDGLTDSVLFTGGDLTKQLDSFYNAITKMPHISNFAILLNGDFADDRNATDAVLDAISEAINARPKKWARAKVLLQISFDEFHQEVYVDKKGNLAERIPVAKIANIVERYPRHASRMQLALLHKQTGLNFSMDVINKGVFARLATELAQRGLPLEVLNAEPSPRQKRNPLAKDTLAPVLKDATFILNKFPNAPILLTSSTIDGYGRAALLDEWETIKEKDLLTQVITQGPPEGERFDIDMMFWFNGWVTLFNAVHLCLGNLYEEGLETILRRQRKDPLTQALHRLDRRLLDYYAEVRDDLAQQIDKATGPHHLFHAITEAADVRLHLTRRLIENKDLFTGI